MIDRRSFIGTFALLAIRPAVPKSPAEILIMRHAEEPEHGPHLNDKGRARAAALPSLFPTRFAAPTFLFAARSSRESERPMETLGPLAARLRLQIDDTFADEKYERLASEILLGSRYADARILICWHHVTLPGLAAALGVKRPPAWPARQYDHIWQLGFSGRGVACVDQPERLLPGDDGGGRQS